MIEMENTADCYDIVITNPPKVNILHDILSLQSHQKNSAMFKVCIRNPSTEYTEIE